MTNVHTNRVFTTDYVIFSCISWILFFAVLSRAIHHSSALLLPFFQSFSYTRLYSMACRQTIEILRTALVVFLSFSRFCPLSLSLSLSLSLWFFLQFVCAVVVNFRKSLPLCNVYFFFRQFDCSICVRPTPLANIVRSFLSLSFAIYQLSFSIERYMDDHTTYSHNEFYWKTGENFHKEELSHKQDITTTHIHPHSHIIEFTPVVFVSFCSFFRRANHSTCLFQALNWLDYKHPMLFMFGLLQAITKLAFITIFSKKIDKQIWA